MGPRAAQVNAPPKNAACLARRRRLRITRRSRSPREAMTTSQHRIEIRRPDDWHLHLRDGAMMRAVLPWRSEEHTSELQSLMRISYDVFCMKKKNVIHNGE